MDGFYRHEIDDKLATSRPPKVLRDGVGNPGFRSVAAARARPAMATGTALPYPLLRLVNTSLSKVHLGRRQRTSAAPFRALRSSWPGVSSTVVLRLVLLLPSYPRLNPLVPDAHAVGHRLAFDVHPDRFTGLGLVHAPLRC